MVTSLTHTIALFASSIVSAADDDGATARTADMAAVGSFLVIGLITLAAIFLIIDMVRRMRRTKYREQVRAELAAEVAEQAGQAPTEGTSKDQ